MVDEWLAARMVGDDWPAAVPDDEFGIAVQVVGVTPCGCSPTTSKYATGMVPIGWTARR
jgi:hypothetical protein